MTSKQKGDILEVIVAAVESTLIDNPTTKIIPNYLLEDKDGLKRDIDVYFEFKANGRMFRYGIECKNFGAKSPLKISHITDMFAKVERTGVNGIIVTTGPIQRNAVIKANKLGIELYRITESEDRPIKQLAYFRKRAKIVDISFYATEDDMREDLKMSPAPTHVSGEKGKSRDIESFTNLAILKRVDQTIKENSKKIYSEFYVDTEEGIQIKVNTAYKIQLFYPIVNLYVFHGKERVQIAGYSATCKIFIRSEKISDPASYNYTAISEQQTIANYVYHIMKDFPEDKGQVITVVLDNDNQFSGALFSSASDKRKVRKMNIIQ